MYLFKKLAAACVAGVSLACAAPAWSAYPAAPITFTVPFPAGGGVDLVARLYAQRIGQATGANIVVENRGGAGGTIGVNMTAHAPADGYHFVLGSPGNISIAPSAYRSLPYQPLKDLKPVGMAVQMPLLLLTRPDAPYTNVADLIRYGKDHPGKLSYGSGGTGTSQHLSGALFAQKAGIDAVHVPYKGTAPVLTDLIGGRLDYTFGDTSMIPTVKAGKLKLLGVASPQRSALLPDTPTIAQAGLPGYAATNWYGFFAPAGTPDTAVAWLAGQVRAALADPAFAQQLKAQLLEAPPAMDSAAFGKFVAQDIDQWSTLIKSMDLHLD
ncbi:Bug family tripartite tricarboxylate transporter substrate binding protein [Achromobacter aloeverae]|uniref:LacI family transcriptional regulator n=1 Tax=Achromobacter aloeverae TaxID=1750518 RepID=A0A4Q1HQB9_9BURK|nr:tripartite tricarboxylate transporter substrate binding protein [Achromobacter aloeverae]RXN93282.1 LacI family transcriptional regulator [Achromobacter aloeverae]